MPQPTAAREFYAFQQRVNFATRNEIRRLWSRMGVDFDGSWRRVGPAVLAVLAEGQSQVANEAARYVPRVLAETDVPDRPEGFLNPDSLVGRASDGRPLETLAYTAVTTAKTTVANGAGTTQALDSGGTWLDMMAALQIADAARQGVGILTGARKNIGGYVRTLNPPSCQRCAILSGKFFRWNTGFDRHPRCDCMHQPVPSRAYAEAEGFIQSPMEIYRAGGIKDLTKAQVKAIEDGADITKVVNAYRGVSTTATRSRTLVKSTRDAHVVAPGTPDLLAFIPNEVRTANIGQLGGYLTPEGIYQAAGDDRDKAIRLLREHGYLT